MRSFPCRCSRSGAAIALTLSIFATFGCSGERPGEFGWIDVPAPPSSRHPVLDRDGDGLIVSWIEPRSKRGEVLRYARRTHDGWTGPSGVGSPDEPRLLRANWSDPPQVRVLDSGDRLAIWSRARGAGNSFDVVLARSPAGAAWGDVTVVGERRGPGQRGWTTLIPLGGSAFGLAWLDVAGDATRLRYQRWDGSSPGPVETLDEDVCPWCRLSGVRFDGRPVLAFRDHGPDELRDVALIRHGAEGWGAAEPIHRDGWITAGCPVSGPALARSGTGLAVAWFSAADDTPRVVVATSTDGSAFGLPVRIDAGDPVGRVALEGWDDGSLFVSWLERVGTDAEVRLRRIAPDGTLDEPITLGRSETGSAAGFPRMARSKDHVYIAWTRPGPPSSVRLGSIRP